jgi:hypothetical protein
MYIPSNQGGGAHVHLATIMAPDEYGGMVGIGNQWINPINPGIAPAALGDNPTQFQIAKNNRVYKTNLDDWITYLSTARALNAQLIAAINPTFLDEIKHDTIGFANTTYITLLEHLQQTNARVTPAQLNKNEQELSREWDRPMDPSKNPRLSFVLRLNHDMVGEK